MAQITLKASTGPDGKKIGQILDSEGNTIAEYDPTKFDQGGTWYLREVLAEKAGISKGKAWGDIKESNPGMNHKTLNDNASGGVTINVSDDLLNKMKPTPANPVPEAPTTAPDRVPFAKASIIPPIKIASDPSPQRSAEHVEGGVLEVEARNGGFVSGGRNMDDLNAALAETRRIKAMVKNGNLTGASQATISLAEKGMDKARGKLQNIVGSNLNDFKAGHASWKEANAVKIAGDILDKTVPTEEIRGNARNIVTGEQVRNTRKDYKAHKDMQERELTGHKHSFKAQIQSGAVIGNNIPGGDGAMFETGATGNEKVATKPNFIQRQFDSAAGFIREQINKFETPTAVQGTLNSIRNGISSIFTGWSSGNTAPTTPAAAQPATSGPQVPTGM